MLLATLNSQKDAIHALVQKYGASNLRVFGSVARGEENDTSDIDFLVDFPAGYDLFGQRLKLTSSLEELLGRKIDLIPEHELSKYIRDEVLRESVKL